MSPLDHLAFLLPGASAPMTRAGGLPGGLPGAATRALVTVPTLRVRPTDQVLARGQGIALVMRQGPISG